SSSAPHLAPTRGRRRDPTPVDASEPRWPCKRNQQQEFEEKDERGQQNEAELEQHEAHAQRPDLPLRRFGPENEPARHEQDREILEADIRSEQERPDDARRNRHAGASAPM